jgi:hypothetical protein
LIPRQRQQKGGADERRLCLRGIFRDVQAS